MTIRRASARRRAALLSSGTAVGVVALLAVLAGPAAAAPPSNHLLGVALGPYSSYQTGRVDIVLPSALPDVELADAQNASVSAGLSVDEILEVVPVASGPQVVAVAFPSQLSEFNATSPGGSATFQVNLSATLKVYPASAALWAGPGATVTPNGPPLGVALLAIEYAVRSSPSPSTGVEINWTIGDWPWQRSADILGVQLGLTTQSGVGLTACSGVSAGGSVARCPGTALTPGATAWGSPFVGLEGETGNGPTASVTWGGSVATSTSASVPVTAGAFGQTGSYGHLFVGGAAGSSPSVRGSIAFSLVNPSLPVAPFVLRGELAWFGASAATCVVAGAVALLAYRRHNRAVEESL